MNALTTTTRLQLHSQVGVLQGFLPLSNRPGAAAAQSGKLSYTPLESVRETGSAVSQVCQSGIGTTVKLILLALCLDTKYNALHIQLIQAQGSVIKRLPFTHIWCSISH